MTADLVGIDERVETIRGFAGVLASNATCVRPRSVEDVERILEHAGSRGVIAHGLGRSYGDAALNGDGHVIKSDVGGVLQMDLDAGTVHAEAGVSVGLLLRLLAPLGWTLPIVPATRHVTVGGAIAADVHGKNHRHAGSFAQWLVRFTLCTPSGTFAVDPTADRELFDATTGGMGLTGVVVDATLRLVRAETTWLTAHTCRSSSLDELLVDLDDRASMSSYAIGWIDALSRGRRLGRGVVVGADRTPLEALPRRAARRSSSRPARERMRVPEHVPRGLLNDVTIRGANAVYLSRASARSGSPKVVPSHSVLMPLDRLPGWNRLYGRQGFVQYQFVVPDRNVEVLRIALERLQAAGCPSYFATLKRLGDGNRAPLSFPMAGWSLSLDISADRQELPSVLDEFDGLVAGAGGRVYLAKDSRLRPEHVEVMYPDIGTFRSVCARVDPCGVMQSDLSRRLNLRVAEVRPTRTVALGHRPAGS